ncbi:DUF1266 domain-containing protein [Aeromonas sp. R5-3]|uniref:DUF1266 domain-containing protein n=1 Tax=Aeromonas TaxID=642 RepID=UPI0034A439ED
MLDNAALAPHEKWWLTLTSPQIAFQKEWREYLKPTSLREGLVDPSTLAEDWNIENRLDLHRQIRELAYGECHGHLMQEEYASFHCMQRSQWQTQRDNASTTHRRASLDFVARTAPYIGAHGIQAWDYGRASYLTREGLRYGWVSEEEFGFIHNQLAYQARRRYKSWLQYTQAWYAGRCLWRYSHEDGEPEQAAHELLYGWIAKQMRSMLADALQDPENPIHGQSWYDVPLPDIEQPQSLIDLLNSEPQE